MTDCEIILEKERRDLVDMSIECSAMALAQWINMQPAMDAGGAVAFEALAVPASDCWYVELSVFRKDRAGRRFDDPSRLRFRIAAGVQSEACTVPIDPVSGNTIEDAKKAFLAAHCGGSPVDIEDVRQGAGDHLIRRTVSIDTNMASWRDDVVRMINTGSFPHQLEMFD